MTWNCNILQIDTILRSQKRQNNGYTRVSTSVRVNYDKDKIEYTGNPLEYIILVNMYKCPNKDELWPCGVIVEYYLSLSIISTIGIISTSIFRLSHVYHTQCYESSARYVKVV